MKVDRKLNLVTEIPRDDGTSIHVHTTPISRLVFETFYRPMSAAREQMLSLGVGPMSGPRVAHLFIRDAAKAMGVWEGPTGVEAGLFTEIRRLTFVIMPGPAGWSTVPFDVACAQDAFSEDEFSEVLGRICFFMLTSRLAPKHLVPAFLSQTNGFWRAQITSLDSTEFANSLPTSTETVNIEANPPGVVLSEKS